MEARKKKEEAEAREREVYDVCECVHVCVSFECVCLVVSSSLQLFMYFCAHWAVLFGLAQQPSMRLLVSPIPPRTGTREARKGRRRSCEGEGRGTHEVLQFPSFRCIVAYIGGISPCLGWTGSLTNMSVLVCVFG